MKIYAASLDEIRKARDEWDAETERRDKIRKDSEFKYDKAKDAVVAPIDYEISTHLKPFNLLDFDIEVEPSSLYYGGRGCRVRVRCNEQRVHDEDSALSWNWSVNVDKEGNIVKDSGSWSGLNAVSEANMASLLQTYRALEYLNSVDWASLLDIEAPKFKDYYPEMPPRGQRPNFEFQMKEAEMADFVGKNIALRGRGIESLGYNERAKNIWYIIERETPKKYVVCTFSDHDIARSGIDSTDTATIIETFKRWPQQIKKEYLLAALEYPFVTLGR